MIEKKLLNRHVSEIHEGKKPKYNQCHICGKEFRHKSEQNVDGGKTKSWSKEKMLLARANTHLCFIYDKNFIETTL